MDDREGVHPSAPQATSRRLAQHVVLIAPPTIRRTAAL